MTCFDGTRSVGAWSALAALLAASAACLGPNPYIDGGEDTGTDDVGDSGTETTTTSDSGTETTADDSSTETTDGTDTSATETGGDHCGNEELDGDETDLDCGGSCMPCADEQGCLEAGDCQSGVCSADSCAAPSCDDEVANGDELEVDCGGSCPFCEHSPFLPELDDFVGGTSGYLPDVTMFGDQQFAVSFISSESEPRVRWFDDLGVGEGPSLVVDPELSLSTLYWIQLASFDDLDTHELLALFPGTLPMATPSDLYVVERSPSTGPVTGEVYVGELNVQRGDASAQGDIAAVVWEQSAQIYLRRYDRDFGGGGGFTDPNPFEASNIVAYTSGSPAVDYRGDQIAVVWRRCTKFEDPPVCSIAIRRFESGSWLDAAPVQVSAMAGEHLYPRVAIAEDGRIGVAWLEDVGATYTTWAAILDPDLQVEGTWTLQSDLPPAGLAPAPDVVALEDGSFAYAWPDAPADRVHLRRFSAPDQPVVSFTGDEAPWPAIYEPGIVRLATQGNLLVAVWDEEIDGVQQIQGQVLSY